MLASLIRQAVQERLRLNIGASLGLAIYVAGICWLSKIPAFHSQGQTFLTNVNRFLFWDTDAVASFDVDWFNFLGLAVVVPTGLIILSALLSHRINNQSHDGLILLLSYPISRTKIFLTVILIHAANSMFLCLTAVLALLLGVWAVGATVAEIRILGMGLGLWLLILFFTLTAFLVSTFSNRQWSAIAIPIGLYLLTASIYLLPGFTSLPSAIRWISPVTPYLDGNPLAFGFNPFNWLIQAGWILVAGIAAWMQFERVDLA